MYGIKSTRITMITKLLHLNFKQYGILATLLMSLVTSNAYGFETDGICYNVLSNGTTVETTYKSSAYGSYKGDVIIPSTVKDKSTSYSVVCIGGETFRDCTALQSVTIPNSVTVIGEYAFRECTDLTSITLPESVTTIGIYAFRECTALKTVRLPNTLKSIYSAAFYYCTALETIELPSSITEISGDAFQYCTSLQYVEIPSSVTAIRFGTFRNCTSLQTVFIPNSVVEIEYRAFRDCTSLQYMRIPNYTTTIGYEAFANCTALEEVIIGSAVNSIGERTFQSCFSLKKITSLSTVPPSCGDNAFDGIDKSSCVLYVPAGSTGAYKTASQWKEFAIIESTDSGLEDVIADSESGEYVVYNLNGVRVLTTTDKADFQQLAPGIYLINGQKYMIR